MKILPKRPYDWGQIDIHKFRDWKLNLNPQIPKRAGQWDGAVPLYRQDYINKEQRRLGPVYTKPRIIPKLLNQGECS